MRIIRKRQSVSGAVETVKDKLQTIAIIDQQMRDLIDQRTQCEQEAEKAFAVARAESPCIVVDTVAGPYSASMVTPAGRRSSVIDPKGFRKLVTNDKDFYACIEVTKKKAEQVLSGKELAQITTDIPAKIGEPVFTIGPVKVGKGRG